MTLQVSRRMPARAAWKALLLLTVATLLLSLSPGSASAVVPSGEVWAWGDNGDGQLGDGTTTDRNTPVQVKGPGGSGLLTGIIAIAGGDEHSLALKSDGTVWAWGENFDGELGDGTTTDSTTPVQVKGAGGSGFLTGITVITGGEEHSLAVKSDGTVWAWGDNGAGQLGDGTTTSSATPVQVKGAGGSGFLTGIIAIAGGWEHSLALKSDGTLWAWGSNFEGQLGDGTFTDSTTPVQVKGAGGSGFLTGIIAVSAGEEHSLALKSDGTVWAWGYNGDGQLGDGTTTSSVTPVQVKGAGGSGFLTGITAIAAGPGLFGSDHNLALKSDGTVWAWGDNSDGQVGDGTKPTDQTTPVQVKGAGGSGFLTGITVISAGEEHSLAVKSDGTVWAWGDNGDGQVGDGTTTSADRTTPVQVKGAGGSGFLMGIIAIAGGGEHSLALEAETPAAVPGVTAQGLVVAVGLFLALLVYFSLRRRGAHRPTVSRV